MKKELLLQVKNLKTYFHTESGLVKAVDDVSFDLYKGETLGIVGESGSGKSVSCLSAMRLIPMPPGEIAGGEIIYHDPEKGPIDLLKLSIDDMRKYRGNKISMIFQEPMTSLNPVFTCGYQVVEVIQLHQKVSAEEAKQRTLALFEEVKLPNPQRIFDAYPHQLSGGQKQRVMIAMAMACKPSILIADEPTTALDVTVQKTILELMNDLRHEVGMSVMFITHDLGVIAEVADRVLVMYKGKIVEQGSVLDIFNNPQHPYTKGLMACRPPLGKRLSKLPVVSDFMGFDAQGNMVTKINSVEDALKAVEISPEETSRRLMSLEQQAPILQVQNLKTYFPTEKNFFGKVTSWVKAVDDVSFDIKPGETLGLVGESGCGKTTLGRTILRLAPATEGKVIYDGKSIFDLDKQALKAMRRNMQIIFQDPYSSLNPRMTIGDAIIEPLKIHNILANDKQRLEKAADLLTTVSMSPDHLNRYPHEFSGGQRQRICIARALALEPKFIICDESVSALDVSVQAQVLNLLIELRQKYQFTYIFISHDLSVVKFMSDRMVVMNKGKIEEMGYADDVYNNPQQEYTKKLIAAIPEGRLEDIQKRMGRLGAGAN
ncbi:MAG: ABC transporter ATP-binding protein [Chitinophagales bacterium]|jgi:peptide/nickel transport system ATP-binding protein|nr:ABC transporter ATP-binding protein [Chitinophagales bacterium]